MRFAHAEETEGRRVLTFKLVDRTDNLTPEPTLSPTIPSTEVQVQQDDGGFANAVGDWEELGGGYYSYIFAAAELADGEGNPISRVRLKVDIAAAAILVVDSAVVTKRHFYADFYGDGFLYWADFGEDGAIPGVHGTFDNPCETLANIVELVEKTGIFKVRMAGQHVWDTDAVGLLIESFGTFFGTEINFEAGGFDASGCVFTGMAAYGTIDAVGGAVFRSAVVGLDIGGGGPAPLIFSDTLQFFDCMMLSMRFKDAGKFSFPVMIGARNWAPLGGLFGGAPEANYDFDSEAGFIFFTQYSGFFGMQNSDSNNPVSVGFAGGVFFADDSNTDGDVTASGNVVIRNQGIDDFSLREFAVIDEGGVGRHVLIDQRQYVEDGFQKLQVRCRRSTFASKADKDLAVPDLNQTPPFDTEPHPTAIKTQLILTTKGPNTNEPTQFEVDTETPLAGP